ncbi:hypothetical protein [Arthrobacter sp. N199823]|uniref:hypothetical protein n=1 Tax=Arthrobacter sp. N199823 TaxID=2058895 RepID=UPI002157C94F|nr:hypothetical protein [Arthrobacter sp. N199823]
MPSSPDKRHTREDGEAAFTVSDETVRGLETGSAIVEFIFLAVLLMVPVAYLILTVGQIQGGAYATVGAADQAAKVFVLHNDLPAAHLAAEQAVRLAVQDMGFDPDAAVLSISCDPGCATAGATVRAHVELRVELPLVGALPGVNATAATVESNAMQKVGRFK